MTSISQALHRAARINPKGIATVTYRGGSSDDAETRTYTNLAKEVAVVSQALKQRYTTKGPALMITKGQRLALLCRNHGEALVHLFVASALGMILAPLNTRWAAPEVALALSDCAPSIIVCDADLYPLLQSALQHHHQQQQQQQQASASSSSSSTIPPPITIILLFTSDHSPSPSPSLYSPTSQSINIIRYEDLLISSPNTSRSKEGWVIEEGGGSDGEYIQSLCYTSGSTGEPKGVMLSHGAQMVQALEKVCLGHYTPQSTYLSLAPLFHIAGLNSSLAITLAGGTHVFLHAPGKARGVGGSELALDAMDAYQVNVLVVVPTMLKALLDACPSSNHDNSRSSYKSCYSKCDCSNSDSSSSDCCSTSAGSSNSADCCSDGSSIKSDTCCSSSISAIRNCKSCCSSGHSSSSSSNLNLNSISCCGDKLENSGCRTCCNSSSSGDDNQSSPPPPSSSVSSCSKKGRIKEGEEKRRALSSIQFVLVGGQSMSPQLWARASRQMPCARFVQSYACSEACSSMTFLELDTRGAAPKPGLVGRPAHMIEIGIIDPPEGANSDGDGNIGLLPQGKVGEIVSRGPHLMKGYWRKKKATRKVLVPLPRSSSLAATEGVGGRSQEDNFSSAASSPSSSSPSSSSIVDVGEGDKTERGGEIWLRTGDLGWLDEQGSLWLVGRIADVIRSGGEKIMASEVERVLRDHPLVAEAAVLGRPDDQYGERCVAAILLRRQEGEKETVQWTSISSDAVAGGTDSKVKAEENSSAFPNSSSNDSTNKRSIEEDIRHYLRQRLAGYKVPKQILFVSSLPLTASGKVLKRKLVRSFL